MKIDEFTWNRIMLVLLCRLLLIHIFACAHENQDNYLILYLSCNYIGIWQKKYKVLVVRELHVRRYQNTTYQKITPIKRWIWSDVRYWDQSRTDDIIFFGSKLLAVLKVGYEQWLGLRPKRLMAWISTHYCLWA